ncbi:MAG: cupin domain-containing protein [Novosphingobium sp.]|uniref:cupin domain-containing protein n=1 Tax=Novosphingobium sp. TaxID=1874826 RepID=UPI0032BC3AA8
MPVFARLMLPAAFLAAGLAADVPMSDTPLLPDALRAGWKGAPVCTLLRSDHTNRLLRCTFAPGIGHERHFHPAHIGYALEGGIMRITDAKGTRDQVLAAGSSYTSAGTPWHEVINIGATPVTYLIFERIVPDPASGGAKPQ